MIRNRLQTALLSVCLLCLGILLTGCEPTLETTPTAMPSATETHLPVVSSVTDTPVPTPTATPIPVAAVVNGEGILLDYFNNEIMRYKAAFSGEQELPAEEVVNQTVLDFLIELQLLSQAARESGFEFSDADLEAKLASMVEELGSGSALTNWMESNFYSDAEFRMALRLSTEAAWQRDQIIAAVPEAVEQVRARQIFARTAAGAERAQTSLNSGTPFDDLAWEYSPETGGELGWFPRGYLLFPEIEEAAFSLAVGERSEIIQTEIGYHILLVMEHEEAYPLTTDARVTLQAKALEDWLIQQRSQALIEIMVP